MRMRRWLLLVLGAALLLGAGYTRGAADRGESSRVRYSSRNVAAAWAGLEHAFGEWERQPSQPARMAAVRRQIAAVGRAQGEYQDAVLLALQRLEQRPR